MRRSFNLTRIDGCLNPISKYWLNKRQRMARTMITRSTVLDVGSRREKIIEYAVSVDINRPACPDVCATVEYLPFRDSSFTYVSFLEMLEHLDSKQIENALAEASRVGSFLLLSTPNTRSRSWNLVWFLWSRTFGREWRGAHKSGFTPESIMLNLERSGFQVEVTNFSRWSLLIRARRASRQGV
jgi:hypothetical protein